jgi:hypothetical protein
MLSRQVFKTLQSELPEDLLRYPGWNPKPQTRGMVASGVTKVLRPTNSTLKNTPTGQIKCTPR